MMMHLSFISQLRCLFTLSILVEMLLYIVYITFDSAEVAIGGYWYFTKKVHDQRFSSSFVPPLLSFS